MTPKQMLRWSTDVTFFVFRVRSSLARVFALSNPQSWIQFWDRVPRDHRGGVALLVSLSCMQQICF